MAAGVLLVHRRVASELAAPKSRRTFCKRRGNGGVRGKHGLLRGAIRGHLGAAGAHRGQSLHLRPREALRQRGEVVVLIGGVRGKHGPLRGAVRGHHGDAGAGQGERLHLRSREARRRCGEAVVGNGGGEGCRQDQPAAAEGLGDLRDHRLGLTDVKPNQFYYLLECTAGVWFPIDLWTIFRRNFVLSYDNEQDHRFIFTRAQYQVIVRICHTPNFS
jgi:hypothetical protein